jgi:DNA polymerase III subunit delta
VANTFSSIIKDIRSKKFAQVYVLDGEEGYFTDKICDALEQHVVSEAERDFNLSIYYGKDAVWSDVVSACRRFPMFAERQLVILREANQMRTLEELAIYWNNPSETTVFVIAYKEGKLDKRKSAFKKLQEKHLCLTSDLVKEEHLPNWIIEFGKTISLNISPQVALFLASSLGSDLSKIENELRKVQINKQDDSNLTEKDVEKYIGISAEYSVFKLPDAILEKNKQKVYKMLNYFTLNPKEVPAPKVAMTFYNAYSRIYAVQSLGGMPAAQIASTLKVSPYFINQSVVQARQFNKVQLENAMLHISSYASKGVGINSTAESTELLKELVYNLMHL